MPTSCAEGDGPCSLRDGKLVMFITTQYSRGSAEGVWINK